MKTNLSKNITIAAFCLVAFSTAGCTEKDTPTNVPMPSEKTATTTTVKGEPTKTLQLTAASSPEFTSVKWIDIKDCTFEARDSFFAGFKQLEARVDSQFDELTAKRITMKNETITKDWDFAMKEMADARSNLKSVGEELMKASAVTWNQQKDTVGQAWTRTQDAYSKVKSTTTI